MTTTGDMSAGGSQNIQPSTATLSPEDILIIQRFNAAWYFAVQNKVIAQWASFASWFASNEGDAALPVTGAVFLTTAAPAGLAFSLAERSVIQTVFGNVNAPNSTVGD